MKAVGIDIGTTTVSAVALDAPSRKVAAARTIANDSFIRTGREWERLQDVAVILQKAKAVLDELLDAYEDVTAIGLTGQMHGIVYIDANGQAVSPLYTWQDGRGDLPVFDGKTLAEVIAEKYHISVSAGFGLVTHLYHVKTGQVPEGAVSFCTVGDYLGMNLTGRKKPLLHSSNAASLGFYDSKNGHFRTEILLAEGIGSGMLPEVTQECEVLGTYRDIPVTVSLGDNQASFLGAVGFQENTILLNMGTGGQISVLSGQYFEAPGIEARPFLNGRYLLAGASLCGGRAYAVLEKFFRSYVAATGGGNREQYETMLRLAEAGERLTDGMHAVTAFRGTRTDPALRGSITNISEDNFTPEGLVYGVLRGMAQELYQMYRLIHEGAGITAHQLVASGNGLRRNPVLQRIFTQMFGADLTMAPCEEEAACGAAVSSIRSGELSVPCAAK